MEGFYLIKLKSRSDLLNYDIGIRLTHSLINEVEEILKDRDHSTIYIKENHDFEESDEISYLYNRLSQERGYFSSSWWTSTAIARKYCAKIGASYMPKEEAERTMKFIDSERFNNSQSDSFLFMLKDLRVRASESSFPLLITRSEANNFKIAQARATETIKSIDDILANLRDLAKRNKINIKKDNHLLIKSKENEIEQEENEALQNPNSYIDLD